MRFRVRHVTHYKYAGRVSHCYNLANVVPRDTDRQRCLKNRITVSPTPTVAHKCNDYFGNKTFHFEIQKPHTELIITADSEIQLNDNNREMNLDLGASYGDALKYLASNNMRTTIEAREFLLNSPMIECSEQLADYARPSFHKDRSLKSCVNDLTTRIFSEFTYDPGFTTIATPLADVLQHKRGVCQDFAHLQVGCLRSMGIPAKYVSGYIETLPKPGQQKLVGADATHAWVAYYCSEEGWVEFDPTNDVIPGTDHITIALGRDYADVCPIQGVFVGGGDHTLNVSVDVAPMGQSR